jgi:hypothetical protein
VLVLCVCVLAAEAHRQRLRRYLTHCALSNTVRPFVDPATHALRFQPESAEELAMVQFGRALGFTKLQVSPVTLEVQEYDEQLQPCGVLLESYKHVATLGFTSQRARVTVVYQRVADGQVLLMTKGQDAVVLPLIQSGVPNELALLSQLKEMSANGYVPRHNHRHVTLRCVLCHVTPTPRIFARFVVYTACVFVACVHWWPPAPSCLRRGWTPTCR